GVGYEVGEGEEANNKFDGMARLFVIAAKSEATAVILRRGRFERSTWYHVIHWDTRRDRFVHGAWMKGRIYEEKCDVSPDGRLLVYFVHQGSRGGTDFTHAWTAISRVPWLQALVLWPQGTTYGGGGRFIDNRSLALRGVLDSPLEEFPLRGICIVDGDTPLHHSMDHMPGAHRSSPGPHH